MNTILNGMVLAFLMVLIGVVGVVDAAGAGELGVTEGLSLEIVLDQLENAIDESTKAGSDADDSINILEAAAELSFVLERDGIESATGHLALGNAYFIGDDLGRAILHYRRGLMIDPGNQTLMANLAHARSFVEPTVPGEMDGEISVSSVLLSWKGVLDRWTLWYLSIGLLGLASAAMTGRMFRVVRVPLMVVGWAAFAGFLGAGLLGFEQWTVAQDRSVVVVSTGTGMYSGPGMGVYQEVYDGPLGVGTEAVALETRNGWTKLELGNDQSGWVINDSFVYVAEGSGG